MRESHSTTVPVAFGRVYKHVESHARRVVSTMTGEQTPARVRRRLRRALERLAACTDLHPRRSLNKVPNVALVLGCTGGRYAHLGGPHLRAFRARIALCRVMEDYDREARPWRFPWLRAEKSKGRPRARRAPRPSKVTPRTPHAARASA